MSKINDVTIDDVCRQKSTLRRVEPVNLVGPISQGQTSNTSGMTVITRGTRV